MEHVPEVLRAELEHPGFPHNFPETTTGDQALAYLRDVWGRARSSPERLAVDVRDVLPVAYTYCLDEYAANDSLDNRWIEAVTEAAVFAEREWVFLAAVDGDIYFDDVDDRRFFANQEQLRTVTSGHLGNSMREQLRTARALGLPLLSSSVEMDWEQTGMLSFVEWQSRFGLICQLLLRVRGSDGVDRAGTEAAPDMELRICRVQKLGLKVSIGSGAAQDVPVNARLQRHVLTVAGRPVEFGSDAARELLRHFSFGQRGNLAADLTGMMVAIDDMSDFRFAVEKFRRSFVPDFELPVSFRGIPDTENPEVSAGEPANPTDGGELRNRSDEAPQEQHSRHETHENGGKGGSFNRERALVQQNALAEELRRALKGEITLQSEDDDSGSARELSVNSGELLGDEIYRGVAAQYEREFGREPEFGDPHQVGWDLRSVHPGDRIGASDRGEGQGMSVDRE